MKLVHIPYSPWSEKARWALDARGIAYDAQTYQPLIGEPALRWMLGRWRGPVSVPVLRLDDRTLADSLEIARFADTQGSGRRLFPAGREQLVDAYSALSERGLAAGRALSLPRMLLDREALLEMIPRPLRKPLGPLAPRIAAAGIRRTLRKYGGDRGGADVHEGTIGDVLDRLRADLGASANNGEPRTLLGELSYADIAMAQVLAFVDPPRTGLRIGNGSRRSFHDRRLAALYPDLLAWRDALYARYRGKPQA
jgi:glutathione S-transferase